MMREPTKKELTDPQSAYYYAKHIIKGRWEQGEAIIATDPDWAYWYAYYVIKGRWEQGEPIIATDPHWAKFYVVFIEKFGLQCIKFCEQCFQNSTLNINELSQELQNNIDIQVAYFKAKVLKCETQKVR
jgi:hypothetical protein